MNYVVYLIISKIQSFQVDGVRNGPWYTLMAMMEKVIKSVGTCRVECTHGER